MNQKLQQLNNFRRGLKKQLQLNTQYILQWIQKSWTKIAAMAFLALLISKKDVHVQMGMDGIPVASVAALVVYKEKERPKPIWEKVGTLLMNGSPTSLLPIAMDLQKKWTEEQSIELAKPPRKTIWKDSDNLANTYSNLTYTEGTFATNDAAKKRQLKRQKQLAYLKRFAHVAKAEQEKFGIPASITLAQGLLESNVGESKLAVKNNNHFGMKCFSRSCKKGHCSNFTDDSHKDFFRKYETAWESYRAHSRMLTGKRYRHLLKLKHSDYKNWAKGLKKAGYATDKHYAEKLINLIEDLELYKY